MIFKPLLIASQVAASCLIPTYHDPEVKFTNIKDIETNKNISLPFEFNFDWNSNLKKLFVGIEGAVFKPNSISFEVQLVEENGKLIRPLVSGFFTSKNGPAYGASEYFVVIPSYDLKLPLKARYKVSVLDGSRLFQCNNSTALSSAFTITKGEGQLALTDDYFIQKRVKPSIAKTTQSVQYLNGVCIFTDYFESGSSSSYSCY